MHFYGHINMSYLPILANGTTIPKHGQNPSVSAANALWTNAYEGKFKPTACYPIMYVISYYLFPFNLFLIYIQGAPRGGLPPGASGMRAPFPGGGGPGMIRGKIPIRNASVGISIN